MCHNDRSMCTRPCITTIRLSRHPRAADSSTTEARVVEEFRPIMLVIMCGMSGIPGIPIPGIIIPVNGCIPCTPGAPICGGMWAIGALPWPICWWYACPCPRIPPCPNPPWCTHTKVSFHILNRKPQQVGATAGARQLPARQLPTNHPVFSCHTQPLSHFQHKTGWAPCAYPSSSGAARHCRGRNYTCLGFWVLGFGFRSWALAWAKLNLFPCWKTLNPKP